MSGQRETATAKDDAKYTILQDIEIFVEFGTRSVRHFLPRNCKRDQLLKYHKNFHCFQSYNTYFSPCKDFDDYTLWNHIIDWNFEHWAPEHCTALAQMFVPTCEIKCGSVLNYLLNNVFQILASTVSPDAVGQFYVGNSITQNGWNLPWPRLHFFRTEFQIINFISTFDSVRSAYQPFDAWHFEVIAHFHLIMMMTKTQNSLNIL